MIASLESLLSRITTLTIPELRTLNRYYLHPQNQRCCNSCFKIFDNYKEHFHVKKHNGNTTAYNVKCADCFNTVNRARTTEYRKDPLQFIKTRFTGYASRAREEGCDFNLTVEYLQNRWTAQAGHCYYSAKLISFESVTTKGNAPHRDTPSLDRLDPTKGYTQGNVVWCSYAMNRMKNDFNYDEFVAACKHVCDIRNLHD